MNGTTPAIGGLVIVGIVSVSYSTVADHCGRTVTASKVVNTFFGLNARVVVAAA